MPTTPEIAARLSLSPVAKPEGLEGVTLFRCVTELGQGLVFTFLSFYFDECRADCFDHLVRRMGNTVLTTPFDPPSSLSKSYLLTVRIH